MNKLDLVNKIFTMVMEHKWEEINKLLKDIDINIKNTNNLYLIYYCILFNQIELLNEILKMDPIIDFIDFEGKTILYLPIKMYYNDVIDKLLEYNNKIIGIDIINIQDNDKNTPLHYAIMFNNIYCIEQLIKYNCNFVLKNIQGNTPLHTAATGNIIILEKIFNSKYFLENPSIINIQNNIGETPLHIACNFESINIIKLLLSKKANVNIYDNTHLTPLFYTITLNNIQSCELLLEYNINLNSQDINGNTPIMYAFQDKNEKIFKMLLEKDLNYNLNNINGRTILHMILYASLENMNIINKFPIKKIIENIDLNFQDNNGNSCLHLLFQTDLWEQYKNILEKKKLNMFIINIFNETPYNLIKNKNVAIDTLIKSYLYILRTENKEWEFEYDKECIIPKLKNNNDLCYDEVKKLIKEKHISIPIKINKFKLKIDTDITNSSNITKYNTYTGIILDILIGILYLHKKYKDMQISSSVTLNFFDNEIIKKHYQSIGYEDKFDFYNFEIFWSYQQLFFPTNLKLQLQNENKNRFFIIPIGIELSFGAHSNIIIIDNELKEIERFEPIGSEHPFGFNYNPNELDRQLKIFFNNTLNDYKYITPSEYLPKIGFQLIETSEHFKQKKIGDPNGFCAGWSNWWVDMRLNNPTISRDKLVNKLIKKIKSMNISFKDIIRNHTYNIVELRDEILNSIDLDINKWLNDNYNEKQIKLLITKLESIIIKI
jgi:ankyrin repeat protein